MKPGHCLIDVNYVQHPCSRQVIWRQAICIAFPRVCRQHTNKRLPLARICLQRRSTCTKHTNGRLVRHLAPPSLATTLARQPRGPCRSFQRRGDSHKQAAEPRHASYLPHAPRAHTSQVILRFAIPSASVCSSAYMFTHSSSDEENPLDLLRLQQITRDESTWLG